MSFRELRNFTEIMKTLGYRKLISVENFRTPNFELVADCLYWMSHRYDPNVNLSDDVSSEDHRVIFLKAVATMFYQRAQIKLNIKNLYQADGYAVKELLKVANILYRAFQNATSAKNTAGGADDDASVVQGGLDNLRDAGALGSEIVDAGSKLHNLLGKEKHLRVDRDTVVRFIDELAFNLESNESTRTIEKAIHAKINQLSDDIVALQRDNQRLESEEKTLGKKIQRKTSELERAEKRLRSLKRVKPEFMKEYEDLEKELVQVYNIYIEKFRNLSYLESELGKHRALDNERKKEEKRQLRRVQKKLREEELRILRGEDVDESTFNHLFSGRSSSPSEHGDLSGSDDASGLSRGRRSSSRATAMERSGGGCRGGSGRLQDRPSARRAQANSEGRLAGSAATPDSDLRRSAGSRRGGGSSRRRGQAGDSLGGSSRLGRTSDSPHNTGRSGLGDTDDSHEDSSELSELTPGDSPLSGGDSYAGLNCDGKISAEDLGTPDPAMDDWF